MFVLNHVNLVVPDPDASADFYLKHLMPKGRKVWLGDSLHLRDGTTTDLAFQKGPAAPAGNGSHHGFLAASAAQVDALRQSLTADGIALMEDWDEDGFRAVKFADPDGYLCEVYWEADWPDKQ